MKKVKTAGFAERVGKAGGEGAVEGIRSRIRPLLEQEIGPFWKKLHEELPGTARETVKQVADEAKTIGSKAIRGLTLPAAIGAGTGAAAAPEGERWEGALQGAAGGLGGGLVGKAWGYKMSPAAARALGIGGSALGGAGVGAALRHGEAKSQERKKPMKNKYAGVTLDWYDDKGATLKDKFPTLESLPGVIKTASVLPAEKLNNEDFALIALDEGRTMRKFACHNAGTTAMSVIYFMEHGDKLPDGAQKVAAANLVRSCVRFNMRPPSALVKTAGMNQLIRNALLGGGIGGGLGAAGGALRAEEGERGRGALIGGGVGGLAGAGLGALGGHMVNRGLDDVVNTAKRQASTYGEGAPDFMEGFMEEAGPALDAIRTYGTPMAAGAGGMVGGGAGVLGSALADRPKTASQKKVAVDTIAGGKADGKPSSDFSSKQMEMGRKVEMEHTDNPQLASEIARDHLEEFGDYYTRLDKMEAQAKQEKRANVVDITGKSPAPKVKVAKASGPADYAVILNGKGYYPINTWDLVKKAEVYYQEEKGRMQPEVRRQYATKLASKAASMGYPLDPDIQEAGSSSWASKGHLQAAVEMRKIACQPGSEDRQFLDELFEKRASLEPGTYAEVLRRFDVQHGLDKGWDHVILDPWASTFGLNKTADVVWEDGADRVTNDQLVNLAQNHLKRLRGVLTEGMCKEFLKDPVGIFESMPLPQKRLISRLASDHPEYSEITQAEV